MLKVRFWLGFLADEQRSAYQGPAALRRVASLLHRTSVTVENTFVAANLLALTEFRAGRVDRARQLCRAEIAYALRRRDEDQWPLYAMFALQPQVNLLRIQGYGDDVDGALAGLARLAPISDGRGTELPELALDDDTVSRMREAGLPVRAFAAEGARVAIASRTATELDRVAAEIDATGAEPMAVPCDVSDPEQVRATVAAVRHRLGGIDVLVNCAGIFRMGDSEDAAVATSREVLATNALGTMLMCQEAGRHMLAAGAGRIVNIASLLSFTAFPGRAAYAASKGAVLQLTRVLGVEWAARGVTVNAIAPGMIAVETPHPAVVAETLTEQEIVRRIPMGRRGRPEDISGPVLFLCSAAADYITGQTLVVDGGWLSYGYL